MKIDNEREQVISLGVKDILRALSVYALEDIEIWLHKELSERYSKIDSVGVREE